MTSYNSLTEAIKARELEIEKSKHKPKRLRPVKDHDGSLLSRNEVGDALLRPDLALGIDWISVSFPVRQVLPSSRDSWVSIWEKTGSTLRSFRGTIPIGQGNATLQVSGVVAMTGYLEFNPSTILHGPKTPHFAHLDQAMELMNEILVEVDYLLERPESSSKMKLSRLDIAANIPFVLDLPGVLMHLLRHGIPPRRKLRSYSSRTNGIESIDVLTKNRDGYRAYNKSLQIREPGSVLRFEAQAGRNYLATTCPTVADLSEEKVRQIFLDKTRFAAEALCSVRRDLLDVILSSPTEAALFVELAGIATLKRAGRSPRLPQSRYQRRYKPFLEKYGIKSVLDLLN
jgi:hypothetical protein